MTPLDVFDVPGESLHDMYLEFPEEVKSVLYRQVGAESTYDNCSPLFLQIKLFLQYEPRLKQRTNVFHKANFLYTLISNATEELTGTSVISSIKPSLYDPRQQRTQSAHSAGPAPLQADTAGALAATSPKPIRQTRSSATSSHKLHTRSAPKLPIHNTDGPGNSAETADQAGRGHSQEDSDPGPNPQDNSGDAESGTDDIPQDGSDQSTEDRDREAVDQTTEAGHHGRGDQTTEDKENEDCDRTAQAGHNDDGDQTAHAELNTNGSKVAKDVVGTSGKRGPGRPRKNAKPSTNADTSTGPTSQPPAGPLAKVKGPRKSRNDGRPPKDAIVATKVASEETWSRVFRACARTVGRRELLADNSGLSEEQIEAKLDVPPDQLLSKAQREMFRAICDWFDVVFGPDGQRHYASILQYSKRSDVDPQTAPAADDLAGRCLHAYKNTMFAEVENAITTRKRLLSISEFERSWAVFENASKIDGTPQQIFLQEYYATKVQAANDGKGDVFIGNSTEITVKDGSKNPVGVGWSTKAWDWLVEEAYPKELLISAENRKNARDKLRLEVTIGKQLGVLSDTFGEGVYGFLPPNTHTTIRRWRQDMFSTFVQKANEYIPELAEVCQLALSATNHPPGQDLPADIVTYQPSSSLGRKVHNIIIGSSLSPSISPPDDDSILAEPEGPGFLPHLPQTQPTLEARITEDDAVTVASPPSTQPPSSQRWISVNGNSPSEEDGRNSAQTPSLKRKRAPAKTTRSRKSAKSTPTLDD